MAAMLFNISRICDCLILYYSMLFFTGTLVLRTEMYDNSDYVSYRQYMFYVFLCNLYIYIHCELGSDKAFVYLHSYMLLRFVGTIPIIIVLNIDRPMCVLHMLFWKICIDIAQAGEDIPEMTLHIWLLQMFSLSSRRSLTMG